MTPMELSDLTRLIKNQLDDRFLGQSYWVTAEVTNLKFYPGKNMYFLELVQKDKHSDQPIAKCSTSIFGLTHYKILAFEKQTGQKFFNALKVLVQVQVDFHAVYGLKLIIRDIDAAYTLGEMEQQRRATLQKLLQKHPTYIFEDDGVFSSANRMLQWPAAISKIAIITSETSDGYADFLHELQHNRFGYLFEVLPFYTNVQGPTAGKQIAEVLTGIERYQPDIIAIVRGGGSQMDLVAFDDFLLAEAIALCSIPIITGIGHLKNESIADMMAHTPAKTPTKVAELIVAQNRSYEERMISLFREIKHASVARLNEEAAHLSYFTSTVHHQLQALLHQHHQQLLRMAQRVKELSKTQLMQEQGQLKMHQQLFLRSSHLFFLEEKKHLIRSQQRIKTFTISSFKSELDQLKHQQQLIRMANPEHILKRGFAIIYFNDQPIVDAEGLKPNDLLHIELSNHRISTTVNSVKPKNK